MPLCVSGVAATLYELLNLKNLLSLDSEDVSSLTHSFFSACCELYESTSAYEDTPTK